MVSHSPSETLSSMLDRIDQGLACGSVHPGSWQAFVREAQRRDRGERLAVMEQINVVSDRLHRRRHDKTLPSGSR